MHYEFEDTPWIATNLPLGYDSHLIQIFGAVMKKEGHPDYQEVLFVDSSTGTKFVCGSTLKPQETEMFEGKKYPVYRVAISSASHPFFTGSKQFLDTEGRVDKFRKRYAKKQEVEQEKPKDEEKKAPAKKAARKTTTKK